MYDSLKRVDTDYIILVYSSECNHCDHQLEELENIQSPLPIFLLDIDQFMHVQLEYDIQRTPFFIISKNSKISTSEGFLSIDQLIELTNK